MISIYQFNGRIFDNGKSWDGLPPYMFVHFNNGRGIAKGNKRQWQHSSNDSFYSKRHANSFKLHLIY